MIKVFTGVNNYGLRQAVSQELAKLPSEYEIVRVKGEDLNLDELIQLTTGVSLFAPERAVVLDQLSANKDLWADFSEIMPRISVKQLVLLIEPQLDKRTKTYKALQKSAEITEFSQLGEADLVNWLQTTARAYGSNLEPQTARLLVNYVGTEQAVLARELDKLTLVSESIDSETVKKYAEPNLEANAFEIIELIVSNKLAQLTKKIDILQQHEDAYRFFGLLSSQVISMLAIKSAGGRDIKQVAADTGANPFALRKLLPLTSSLTLVQIGGMLELLRHCDRQMKSTSNLPWQLVKITVMQMAVINKN